VTTTKPCAVIVWDKAATAKAGSLVTRPCGAPTRHVLTVRGDTLFAACSRHDDRLNRAFGLGA
jgi:hypothetical protein